MSDRERKIAKEVFENFTEAENDAKEYVRGYLQGRLDGVKNERRTKEEEDD